jgi:hypothetical protein
MKKRVWLASALLSAGLIMNTSPTYGWTIQENFDGAAEGSKPSSSGSDWFSSTKVTSQVKHGSSGKSAALTITSGKSGSGEFGGILKLPKNLKEGEEIWYRVRTYMPSSFDYRSSTFALKFMRTHTAQANGSNRGYLDLYIRPNGTYFYQSEIRPGQLQEDFSAQSSSSLRSNAAVQKEKWETYEVYYKFSSTPGSGIARVWKDGKLMYENRKWETLASSSDYVDAVYLFTYWNGHAPKTQTVYVDDIFVTNERPSNRDSAGNPYIGVGDASTSPTTPNPSPPVLRITQ